MLKKSEEICAFSFSFFSFFLHRSSTFLTMPRSSQLLAPGSKIKISKHYLRRKSVFQVLSTIAEIDQPKYHADATVIGPAPDDERGRKMWSVKLDKVPDMPFDILATAIGYADNDRQNEGV